MPNLSGPTLIVILFIVLLLFGAPKLPALARSLGQSMKILKKEVSTPEEKDTGSPAASEATTNDDAAASPDPTEELAQAKAEAEALRAETEALRAENLRSEALRSEDLRSESQRAADDEPARRSES